MEVQDLIDDIPVRFRQNAQPKNEPVSATINIHGDAYGVAGNVERSQMINPRVRQLTFLGLLTLLLVIWILNR